MQNNSGNNIKVKIILLFIFLLLIYVLYEAGAFRFFMDKEKILAFIYSLGPLGWAGFVSLQVLQVVAAPIPGEVTGLIGGYLYGPLLGVLLSTIGLTIGSLIAFSLSRIFGRPFVEKFVKKETMEKYDFLLHHKGAFLVFLLFLIPGTPKDFLCYILGLGHLTTREFLIMSTVGRLGGTVLLTLGGNYIHQHQYRQFFVLLGAAVIVVFFTLAYKDRLETLFRIWHKKSEKTKKAEKMNRLL